MSKSIWDRIYKDYEKGGKAWASLSDDIHPSFLSFLKRNRFERKSVLDLGCGNGKYLAFLQKLGFEVAGIDSSPTAIKMARKKLAGEVSLHVADMYTTSLSQKLDLLISIAAIQHADKLAITQLVGRIHRSLVPGGKIFITFPRMSMLRRWNTFGKRKEVAPGTYIPLRGPEKGLPHSFYEKEELAKLFSDFKNVNIKKDNMGRWVVTGLA